MKSALQQDQGMEVCFETNEQQQQQQSLYSHYSDTKAEKKKMRIQETIKNEMMEIIQLYVQFESVCNSQSSKASSYSLATFKLSFK